MSGTWPNPGIWPPSPCPPGLLSLPRPTLPLGPLKPLRLSARPPPHPLPRPLIKLHIIWKKDGALLSGGISDYNRRLTIPNPTGSDAGYYECEAVLRSSSVPSVVRGAYLSVLGEMGQGGSAGVPLRGRDSTAGAYVRMTQTVAISTGAWL